MGSRRLGRKRLYSLNKKGQSATVAAGPGIADAIVSNTVRREGHKVVTEIVVDLGTSKATVASLADDGDAIGVLDAGAAYLTQITTAVNGFINYAEMQCVEVPVGGAIDIDLTAVDEATFAVTAGGGAADAAGGGNPQTLIDAGAVWTAGEIDHYAVAHGTAHDLDTADQYLYLTSGAATAGDYTAGKFVITLEGYVAPDDI
jgi:hypothetical protein